MGLFTDLDLDLYEQESEEDSIFTPVEPTPKGFFSDLDLDLYEEGAIPSIKTDHAVKSELETERRTGEGFFGGVGDVVAAGVSGAVTGVEMISKTFEWFAPEGSDVELGANTVRTYLEDFQKEHDYYLGESERSQEAREGSYLHPRGWIYGGMESIGMIIPTSMLAGPIGVFGQFWGSTAQDAYDEAVENEKNGIGRKLSETEKLAYANLRGFWEGGIEAIQTRLFMGLGKGITKFLPKTVKGNIIRSAVKQPGNPFYNAAKNFTKTLAQEEAMELGQEYAGQKTQYKFGQSTIDPGWDEIKAVIGPTFIMTAVFGTMGGVSSAKRQKQLHDTITNPADLVHPEDRAAAATIVYEIVKKEDNELAEQWKEMVAPAVKINAPLALPLDAEVKDLAIGAKDQDLVDTQVGVEKLKEAQTIEEQIEVKKTENRELNAQAQGKEEARIEVQTEEQVKAQIEAQVERGEEVPDVEGVIEPQIEKTTKSMATIERQIGQMTETLKDMSVNDPRRTKLQGALTRVEAEREALDTQTDLSITEEIKNGTEKDTTKITEEISETGAPERDRTEAKQQELSGEKEEITVPQEEALKRPEVITQEYVDKKYEKILAIPEDIKDNLSEEFDADEMSIESVTKELQNSKDVEITKQALLAHVADRTGDIVPTSRYESDIDGEAYEARLDKLVEVVDNFGKSEDFQNLFDNKLEIKYSISEPGELRVPFEEIPENIEVTTDLISSESGQEDTTKIKARTAIKFVDSLITKLDNILECVQ